ncbi:MAG: CCA tRNA nucleotidyltransferase [Planctomycetota bacterium]|nr:CCA tRNA nucleotidyltransferase [Planctomycetota bacterium]
MNPAHPDQPPHARVAATSIVRTLRDAGHLAYFAGGCVRDELLDLAPSDYDVATDATPDRVSALFPRSGEVGKSFGVVIVRLFGEVVEVATFRTDDSYSDRRRPDAVRFSTPEDDAQRRDYTVNALFLDPFGVPMAGIRAPRYGGAVIDYVGGMRDLDARVLRAVGDPHARLDEDHLRALRGARLAARLGFDIEPATAAAIRAHASQLAGVSRERIGDEVRRILLHPTRARGVALLQELALEPSVLEAPPQAPGTALAAPTPGALPRLAALPPDASVGLCLAAWALDRHADPSRVPSADLVRDWRRALCLSNDERDEVADTLRLLAVLRTDWDAMGVAPRKRAAASAAFGGALTLLAVESPSLGAARRADLAALAASGIAPPPLLGGDDLIALGARPGPAFRGVLDSVYDAQLEGRVATAAQARDLARELLGGSGVS